MTSQALAAALHRIATTDDVVALTQLAEDLQREHPGDDEAALTARHALLKRRRIIQES